MFVLTADVYIGDFKPVKPNELKWSSTISNFTDSATIKLPAITMLKTTGEEYERVQTGLQFKEGMKVTINAGYNGRNVTRFKGFVSRINFTIPLEVECEGYSYQLRKKLNFTKSYKNTNVKLILEDLIQGTDIKLSNAIPNIPLDKATFENCTGINVLEWLKEKCLLTVYFNFDTLYVGLMQAEPSTTVKFRLGWNTVKDNELKFNTNKEFADVRIELSGRQKDGTRQKAFVGKKDGQVKRLKTAIKDKEALSQLIKQQQINLLNAGYEGSILAFLEPYIEKGMAIQIEDPKYPERTGTYFCSGIGEASLTKSGGRQKVLIGNNL